MFFIEIHQGCAQLDARFSCCSVLIKNIQSSRVIEGKLGFLAAILDFLIIAKPEVKKLGHLRFSISMVYTTTVKNVVLLEGFLLKSLRLSTRKE